MHGEFLLAQTRQAMLEASGLKTDDLVRAVKRNRKLLNAKNVKYVVHGGEVVERKVDNHDAQARAVELFYDVFGVKAPRSAPQSTSLGVAIEIDPATGVIRVVAGQRQPLPVVDEGSAA